MDIVKLKYNRIFSYKILIIPFFINNPILGGGNLSPPAIINNGRVLEVRDGTAIIEGKISRID